MPRAPILAVCLATAMVPAQAPSWRWLATEHLGCLTPPRALAEVGLAGTDLGVSFPCGDRLVFLFGDSWTLDRKDWDVDSVAVTELAAWRGDALPPLQWRRRDGGRFHGLAPTGLALGGMNVPVEGITLGDRSYVFFSDGWSKAAGRHSHSVCAHAKDGDFLRLELDHRVATGSFVNVSLVADGDTVWIFGSGAYRKSSVCLARVEAAELGNRAAWRYWPDFTADEAAAKPIVPSDCIGELSVRRLPGSEMWWMTCNAAMPRGIHLRTALAPTGPWSDPIVIFDPSRDRGYGHTMHQKRSAVGYDDGLSEPGREEDWGGEYGPYLVPQWCRSPAPAVQELVYTMSTWNPYTVRVLRSHVAAAGVEWQVPVPTTKSAPARAPKNLGFAKGKLPGWQQEADAFTEALEDRSLLDLLEAALEDAHAEHAFPPQDPAIGQDVDAAGPFEELPQEPHGADEDAEGDGLVVGPRHPPESPIEPGHDEGHQGDAQQRGHRRQGDEQQARFEEEDDRLARLEQRRDAGGVDLVLGGDRRCGRRHALAMMLAAIRSGGRRHRAVPSARRTPT